MKKIRRMAGASAGAMTATLVSVGYKSAEIEAFLAEDMNTLFIGKYFKQQMEEILNVAVFNY